jgi:hypothetical protein
MTQTTVRNVRAAQLVVRSILEDPMRQWTVQGLGMLRTYLPDNARLHIWNPALKFEEVSEHHTHPWDLVSHKQLKMARDEAERAATAATPSEAMDLAERIEAIDKVLGERAARGVGPTGLVGP